MIGGSNHGRCMMIPDDSTLVEAVVRETSPPQLSNIDGYISEFKTELYQMIPVKMPNQSRLWDCFYKLSTMSDEDAMEIIRKTHSNNT